MSTLGIGLIESVQIGRVNFQTGSGKQIIQCSSHPLFILGAQHNSTIGIGAPFNAFGDQIVLPIEKGFESNLVSVLGKVQNLRLFTISQEMLSLR